jgi:hypothetical protein
MIDTADKSPDEIAEAALDALFAANPKFGEDLMKLAAGY